MIARYNIMRHAPVTGSAPPVPIDVPGAAKFRSSDRPLDARSAPAGSALSRGPGRKSRPERRRPLRKPSRSATAPRCRRRLAEVRRRPGAPAPSAATPNDG